MLLILREETVSLFVLVFLMAYSFKFIRENGFFLRLNLFSLCHVVFDLITIYTVNHLDTVSPRLNAVCHVSFYVFAILFCCELFRFVVDVLYGEKIHKSRLWLIYLIPAVFVAFTPLLRIDYLQGNGSNYSYGPCVFVGYGLAMLLFFASEALLLCNYRKLEPTVKKTLVPSFALMSVAVVLQVFVPELLFTGAAVTLVTLGVFLSIANPMEKYRERAFYDTALGIKNRNAYTDEMRNYAEMPAGILYARRFTLVVFDLNGLKRINDQFGHPVGDQYLKAAAEVIQTELRSAAGIYRTGGDEFAAIYLDCDESVVRQETANVETACAARAMAYEVPLSVSFGYSIIRKTETVYSVECRADGEMFDHKRIRYENTEFDRRKR